MMQNKKLQEANEIASQEAKQPAFNNAKNYTDGVSPNTDRKLRQMESSIEQNGRDINLQSIAI